MRRTRLVATALLCSLALAACGGSSDSSKSDSSKGGSDSSSDSGSKTDDTSTGNEKLDALLAKAKTANVKVTYKSGSSGSNSDFTLIQYNGDTAFAMDDATYYSVGGKTVQCEGSGSDAQCTEVPGGEAMVTGLTTAFFGIYSGLFGLSASDKNPLFSTTSDSEKTIAGRTAKCTTLKAGGIITVQGSVTACVDSETGVMLLGRASSDGESGGIEATSFADSTKQDVTPPVEPQTIPGT